ncbi:hypothetical protein BT63DRAFT_200891 [Microthyrium microscopicum]|uniref:WW domain-containing protein n=1 Tax=Microthyrium microscopicum TaxID=703497 RepID=A0A6A6UGT3_9PEZI|nr:hypothetical protein BT63DRAFT_200891 [Microthyrium microscopicum]
MNVQQPLVLPQGWKAEHSPQHNRLFYINTLTNESVWQIPTTFNGPPQIQAPQPAIMGCRQPQQQSGTPQPNQPGIAQEPLPPNGPVGDRGFIGDMMGSLTGSKPVQGVEKPVGLLSSALSFGSSRLFGGKKQATPQTAPPAQPTSPYQQGPPPQQRPPQIGGPPQQFPPQIGRPPQGQPYAQGPPQPYQQNAYGPPRPNGQMPQQPQPITPVAANAAKPAKTGQAALVGGIAALGLGGVGAMSLKKHAGSLGGLFGKSSNRQSASYNNGSQPYQDPSQQIGGDSGYYPNADASQQQQNSIGDPTQQLYADPSSDSGAQAGVFDPNNPASYPSDSSQTSYIDPTTGQSYYNDPNLSAQQSYSDPSYSTQAYTDPSYNTQAYTDPSYDAQGYGDASYDTTGQSYAPADQYYSSGEGYTDPVQAMDEMNSIETMSEQISDTYAQTGEDVAEIMDE